MREFLVSSHAYGTFSEIMVSRKLDLKFFLSSLASYMLFFVVSNLLPEYLISLFHAEARQAFKDSCSVQVYSIQACIPKDTAVLWNPEFVQAEELFNQPFYEDNCLRDNRYCSLSPPGFPPESQGGIPRKEL